MNDVNRTKFYKPFKNELELLFLVIGMEESKIRASGLSYIEIELSSTPVFKGPMPHFFFVI